jgi:hypothetical protein
MNRQETIAVLSDIQLNIEIVERQVNQKIEDNPFYGLFGNGSKEFEHNKEIRKKALAFWKRKFNKTLVSIIYINHTYNNLKA